MIMKIFIFSLSLFIAQAKAIAGVDKEMDHSHCRPLKQRYLDQVSSKEPDWLTPFLLAGAALFTSHTIANAFRNSRTSSRESETESTSKSVFLPDHPDRSSYIQQMYLSDLSSVNEKSRRLFAEGVSADVQAAIKNNYKKERILFVSLRSGLLLQEHLIEENLTRSEPSILEEHSFTAIYIDPLYEDKEIRRELNALMETIHPNIKHHLFSNEDEFLNWYDHITQEKQFTQLITVLANPSLNLNPSEQNSDPKFRDLTDLSRLQTIWEKVIQPQESNFNYIFLKNDFHRIPYFLDLSQLYDVCINKWQKILYN